MYRFLGQLHASEKTKLDFVETRVSEIKNSLKFCRVELGLARSYINHFSGLQFWHQNSNVLVWSDPAFNEGLCRHSKLHPIAIQNNVQPRSAQDSDLSPTQWFVLGVECCFQGLTLQQEKLRQRVIPFSECHSKPFFSCCYIKNE